MGSGFLHYTSVDGTEWYPGDARYCGRDCCWPERPFGHLVGGVLVLVLLRKVSTLVHPDTPYLGANPLFKTLFFDGR